MIITKELEERVNSLDEKIKNSELINIEGVNFYVSSYKQNISSDDSQPHFEIGIMIANKQEL